MCPMKVAPAIVAAIVLLTTRFHAGAADAPAVPDHAAADVSLIASWLTGSAEAKAFERDFGDSGWITGAKDAIFYSDVDKVTVPAKLRRVPYDFIAPRIERIRNGHK